MTLVWICRPIDECNEKAYKKWFLMVPQGHITTKGNP